MDWEKGEPLAPPQFDETMRDLVKEEAERLKAARPDLNSKGRKKLARETVLKAARS